MGFLKSLLLSIVSVRQFSKTAEPIMKFLNVAEKNDAAKNIASFLSRGTARRREGLSKYNKIYEFDSQLNNQTVNMVMTSVSGHLLKYEFPSNYRRWESCNPVSLFDAPIIKSCITDSENIKKTLEREVKHCSALIIWTDCDREGENIGFEIIKVCTDVKPNIRIYRAKFSEITAASVTRALNTIGEPNKNVSDAVDVRQEIDLRTGASFTRLQTLHFSKIFPQSLAVKLISYGSCQFPTLGFVVERYQEIERFIPEDFWRIKMAHTKNDLTIDFQWERDRLFVKQPCVTLLEICKENPTATVMSVISKRKTKWRPFPLDTIEMEKTISRKLKITAKETMNIAERLYTQGFISYPRTETNIFPSELNLTNLVNQQTNNQQWGEFASRIINDGGPTPKQGKKTDHAHPPIHPTKAADNLHGDEKRVYEFIVRHFLACCYKDAVGDETIVKVKIVDENFTAKGLTILEKNYLDVYIYEKWNAKEIHNYTEGETFQPTGLELAESSTVAPNLLTEPDLITLMEKNGIGTDATHADHIDTIQSREYAGIYEKIYFMPGVLGMGLVEGYDNIGLEVSLAKPNLRADFEKDLKLICEGTKTPQEVLQEQIAKYRAVFINVMNRLQVIEERLAARIQEEPVVLDNPTIPTEDMFKPVLKCPKCGNDMILRDRKNQQGMYLACSGFPACKNAVWFSGFIEKVEVTDETCENCIGDVKKLKFKFRQGQNPFLGEPNIQTLCIGGCDMNVLNMLCITESSVKQVNRQPNVGTNNRTQQPPTLRTQPFNNQNNTRNVGDATFHSRDIPSGSTQTTTSSWNRNESNSSRSDSGYNTWIRPNQGLSGSGSAGTSGTVPQNRSPDSWNTSRAGGNTQNNKNEPNADDVVCNCGTTAVLLTVRKEGPNKGKKFYKCQGNNCDFFLWGVNDDLPTDRGPSTSSTPSVLICNCGQPAVERIVQKEGPNKGRVFFVCPGPMNKKCNFFKWASDVNDDGGGGYPPPGGGGGAWNNSWSNQSSSRGRGSSQYKRKAPDSNQDGRKNKRKCGICGEEGHNRTKCPNKD